MPGGACMSWGLCVTSALNYPDRGRFSQIGRMARFVARGTFKILPGQYLTSTDITPHNIRATKWSGSDRDGAQAAATAARALAVGVASRGSLPRKWPPHRPLSTAPREQLDGRTHAAVAGATAGDTTENGIGLRHVKGPSDAVLNRPAGDYCTGRFNARLLSASVT